MRKRSTSIVYLRGFSAIFIFVCHVLFIAGAFQASMWFNVGVPIFFIISAYLLSLKNGISTNIVDFYKRRARSIYPSYLIYLLFIVFLLIVIGRGPDTKSIICYSLGLSGFTDSMVLGLGHLWFISVLLLCYLITPLLHRLCQIRSSGKAILSITVLLIILFILFFLNNYPSYSIHIASYVYVYCFYNRRNGVVTKHQTVVWAILAAILSIARLAIDPYMVNADHQTYYYYDALFQPIARFGLAMFIFTFFIYQSQWIEDWSAKHSKGHRLISKFSDYSYEVYLTHQFILLAIWEFVPFAREGIGLILWITLSFIATIFNTLILVHVKSFLFNNLLYNNKQHG